MMDHKLRVIWPDGSAEMVNFTDVVGLTKQINGERLRPLALLYDGNVDLIMNAAKRDQLIDNLRSFGAYWKS